MCARDTSLGLKLGLDIEVSVRIRIRASEVFCCIRARVRIKVSIRVNVRRFDINGCCVGAGFELRLGLRTVVLVQVPKEDL